MTNMRLNHLRKNAHPLPLDEDSRYVIFSDLHMGNGKRSDDFIRNSTLFSSLLNQYYLKEGYTVILNGDIEELQKFSMKSIRKQWKPLLAQFDALQDQGRLMRTVGNHDMPLPLFANDHRILHNALHMEHPRGSLLIFHGHQVDNFITRYNKFIEYSLKIFARTLGIRNFSSRMESQRIFKTEKAIYNFSNENKLISIIGHTHRPLFESFSKVDNLRFRIEKLLREYAHIEEEEMKQEFKQQIRMYRKELGDLHRVKNKQAFQSSLYNVTVPVPSLFNSGCCIGKTGITCLELTREDMTLSYWRDMDRPRRSPRYRKKKKDQLSGTHYERIELKKDSLEYIFDCLELLTD